MYSTQTVAEALKSFVPPEMFLQRNLFGIERYYTSRYLALHVKKARRVLSPVVSRFSPGVPVKRPAIQTTVYDSPKMAPYRVTSLGDLDIRAPGLTATDPAGSASDVYVNILADDTQDLSDIIWRRIELFASQILFTGRVRYRLDGGEYEEFGFGPGVPNVYNPPIPWHQPGATPITDLKAVRSQIIRDTGRAPDIVVFSDRTADLFAGNQQVLDQLNKLHFVVGQIEPTRPTGTAQWLGRLLLPALEMWAYSESYIDEYDGESVSDFVPPWAALVGTTQPSGFTYFGSVSRWEAIRVFRKPTECSWCRVCTTTSTMRPLSIGCSAERLCVPGTSPAGLSLTARHRWRVKDCVGSQSPLKPGNHNLNPPRKELKVLCR
jgi:hypothetical protein